MSGLFPNLIQKLDRIAFAKALGQTFDGIFCLNLDHRTDLWDQARQHFREYEIESMVTRFSGMLLRERPGFAELDRLQSGKYSVLSCAGCAYSHRAIVQRAREEGLKSVLILEDDVKFLAPEYQQTTAVLSDLRERDWSIFYLGGTYNKPLVRETPHLLSAPEGAHALHAIAFHEKVYDDVINCLPDDPMDFVKAERFEIDAIDVWMQQDQIGFGEIYVADPLIAVQRAGDSEINTKKFVDFEKFQRDLFGRQRPPGGVF